VDLRRRLTVAAGSSITEATCDHESDDAAAAAYRLGAAFELIECAGQLMFAVFKPVFTGAVSNRRAHRAGRELYIAVGAFHTLDRGASAAGSGR
jgi:hypothetical protein